MKLKWKYDEKNIKFLGTEYMERENKAYQLKSLDIYTSPI